MTFTSKNSGIYQNQEYVEVDQRVREEKALLHDLERTTPKHPGAIATQQAVLQAATKSRRKVLRRLIELVSPHDESE